MKDHHNLNQSSGKSIHLLFSCIQASLSRCCLFFCFLIFNSQFLHIPAHAERIKDLTTIQGVRSNQLIGYGLVVGLDGTGDQTIQTPFTLQSTISMLQQMGIVLPPGTNMFQIQLKNIAAVMVTASLGPFAQPGQTMDVTVSSMGNAKSLRGGTLLMTSLKGADSQVYAIAQGNVVIGGAGAAANGTEVQINQLSAGRISAGATVEREVQSDLTQASIVDLELKDADFSTANAVANAINTHFKKNIAHALNSRVIQVDSTHTATQRRVAFLAEVETIDVRSPRRSAKVIMNARTGSIVMNDAVLLESCAVAHGNLSVEITTVPVVSQPNAFASGRTIARNMSRVEINKESGNVIQLNRGASLSEVVVGLNAIGATPQDLLAILQAMKAAGSLRADLEII
jgi:flagellar P-ring protein precursor FlgI